MAKREYRVGNKIVMNDNFSMRSKYYMYSGRQGRIAHVNGRSVSYDIELDGTGTRLEYVDAKMFRSADDIKTPEQKREALKKSLTARRADAEKVIEEKKAFIVDMHNRIDYLNSNEGITEIDETAYTAWLIAFSLLNHFTSRKAAEASGAKTLSNEETVQVLSSIVLNVLKTNNK